MPSYLVTGANRGLGVLLSLDAVPSSQLIRIQYGFVRVLAHNPDNVIFGIVRNKAAAEAIVKADGLRNVHLIQADISDRKSLLAAREDLIKACGGSLDYLINNAAYVEKNTEYNALDDFEEDSEALQTELQKSFEINVIGVIDTINVFLPLIRRSSIKKIVVISSGMADPDLVNGGSIWNSAPYTISKAAVNMAVAKYNAHLGGQGILVFALSPGVVATFEVEPAAIDDLRKMMPNWTGPLTPVASAEMCLKVIEDFTVEKGNGGSFVSHYGNKQWL